MPDALLPKILAAALVGLGTLLLMVHLARHKRPRTRIELQHEAELWPLIELWCRLNHYHLHEQNGEHRVYLRGNSFSRAAARLEIRRTGHHWQLEACILIQAWIASAELALDEQGWLARLPREQRKQEFNRLLLQLGQPLLT